MKLPRLSVTMTSTLMIRTSMFSTSRGLSGSWFFFWANSGSASASARGSARIRFKLWPPGGVSKSQSLKVSERLLTPSLRLCDFETLRLRLSDESVRSDVTRPMARLVREYRTVGGKPEHRWKTSGGQVKQESLSFSKMAGGGNDFVVIDNRTAKIADAGELTRRICTRALSVGADGLILIEGSARATFRMRYYNADGGLAAFCGNGTRCAARFAFLNVIAGRKMTIETDAGIVGAEIGDGGLVTISMPTPHSFRAQRPLTIGDQIVRGSFMM